MVGVWGLAYLEYEVCDVDEKQQNGRASGDDQEAFLVFFDDIDNRAQNGCGC